jgi:hypothetical protein
MLTISESLSYYKRKDVQRLILEHAKDKEIGIRFGDSFGKRPDILVYDNDILESAKRGCTSIHCSEETWTNPLNINSNMRRNELDELRSGWDLILDIDCPYWNFSKLTTYVFIKALKDHGINCVTVKFSGGKGFHIAVPFEAFPQKVLGVNVKNIFPEGPRKIAEYLLYYITENLIHVDIEKNLIKFGKVDVKFDKMLKETEKTEKDLTLLRCNNCKRKINIKSDDGFFEYVCPNCEYQLKDVDKKFISCPKCKKIMDKYSNKKALCECGSSKTRSELDLSSIVNVDTVLISSRHLFRMPYSLHEKTGLVSMPFDIKHILKFEKIEADVKKCKAYKFLDREEAKSGEAETLFQKAFDYKSETIQKHKTDMQKMWIKEKREISSQNLDATRDNTPVLEDFFPPCIKKISAGLDDGKKRALLVLINFLSSANWEYDKIEEYVLKWNAKNKPDQLRETYIRGQLRYYKQQASHNKDKMMAPNCDNKGYMIDTQFCNPDGLCKSIKNPVQYSKKRAWMANNLDKKPVKKKENKKEDFTANSSKEVDYEEKNVKE